MKIEVLFPEICNLYGELGNIRYLKESLPDAEFVETRIKDKPLFLDEDVDMVYMGTMSENSQLMVIEALTPYRKQIEKRIEEGMNFLVTGNAIEVFGGDIIEEGMKVAEGLGIFDIEARRSARKRYNTLYVGEFYADENHEPLKIVGFKSLFGYGYGSGFKSAMMNTVLGYGSNPDIKEEGIRVNNFMATYLTGPVFILNPLFMKWYMNELLGVKDAVPKYFDAAMDAYNVRLEEYLQPGKGWQYH